MSAELISTEPLRMPLSFRKGAGRCSALFRFDFWISRFGASHGFYTETVASVKTADKFGTAANIEAFDAKWRCPAKIKLEQSTRTKTQKAGRIYANSRGSCQL